MTRYRPQRGSFAESHVAMITVASHAELVEHLRRQHAPIAFYPEEVEVKLYQDFPDWRIGWNKTYIVTIMGQGVGFTDGPLMPESEMIWVECMTTIAVAACLYYSLRNNYPQFAIWASRLAEFHLPFLNGRDAVGLDGVFGHRFPG